MGKQALQKGWRAEPWSSNLSVVLAPVLSETTWQGPQKEQAFWGNMVEQ